MLDVGSPFPSCFRFRFFRHVVTEADALATVETEVGLFVPARGAVWVSGDLCVVLS
jgi:hypothetical protein